MFETVTQTFRSFMAKDKVMQELALAIENHKATRETLNAFADLYGQSDKIGKLPEMKTAIEVYYRNVERAVDKKYIANELRTRYTQMADVVDVIAKYVSDNIRSDIISGAVTVQQSAGMYLLFALSFLDEYTLHFISAAADVATNNKDDRTQPPYVFKYVNQHALSYASVMGLLATDAKKFKTMLDEAADTVINDDTAASLNQLYANSSLAEVFKKNLGTQNFNRIVLNIRMILADRSVEKYKVQKETRKQLELRLLKLKLEAEGKDDPRLQQEIEYIQGRVDKLQAAIDKFEQRYQD